MNKYILPALAAVLLLTGCTGGSTGGVLDDIMDPPDSSVTVTTTLVPAQDAP